MHFAPNEEQAAFLDGVRRLLDELGGKALVRRAMAREDGVEPKLWAALAEVGVFGLPVAEVRGGQGAGWLECCLLLEVLGGYLCEGPVLAHLLAIVLLERFGGETLRDRWLPGLIEGRLRAAVAVEQDGRAVPFAVGADVVLAAYSGRWFAVGTSVSSNADDDVAIDAVGVLDPAWRCADITVDEAAWNSGNRFDAAGPAAIARDLALAALACAQTGLAQTCLDISVAYAGQRHQFGRPIGSFQAVQHRCADMLMAVETARSAAWYAAWCSDHSDHSDNSDHSERERADASAVAACWCAVAAYDCAASAIQVHGGIGFTWEHDCQLLFKRAEIHKRLFGEPQQHRLRLASAAGL